MNLSQIPIGILKMTLGSRRAKRALAATVGLGLGISGSLIAFAVTGSPSGFESADGNMTLQTSGNTDWNCFQGANGFATLASGTPAGCAVTSGATQTAADSPPAGEVTWVKGEKFDTLNPLLESKSTPPKDDFVNVAAFTEIASNGDIFFYGAQIRAVNNGNASGNIEFDKQSGTPGASLGNRVAGDRLIAYDFINGGTGLVFHLLTWIDSTDPCVGQGPACTNPPGGSCFVKTDPLPCWGANVATVPGSLFDGQSNQSAISAADNGISNTAIGVNQFAEFGVNLTEALGLSGTTCQAFPQQVWESRSSGSSFTSSPEDIEVQNLNIQNCGEIKIIKQTDPRGTSKDFSFTSDIPAPGTSNPASPNCTQSFSNPTSFTLNDAGNTGKTLGSTDPGQNSAGNTQDCTSVLQNTYHVTEGALTGTGFHFESLTCTADTISGSSVSTSSQTATIILKPGGLVTCVYVNQPNTATMSTQVSATTVFPGTAVSDTATVTGTGDGTPTGNVEFFLCGPLTSGTCASSGIDLGSGTLSGTGTTATATSPNVNTSSSPLAAGLYCFRATWPGDSNYPGTLTDYGPTGTNECFTVRTIPTTTTTTPSVGSGGTTTFGSSVTDHAIVQATQSGDGTPTGTIQFFVCDPTHTSGGACPSGGTTLNTATAVAVSGSTPPASSADSTSVTVNMTGTWCFRAVYTPGGANGANYTGSSDASSSECFTVTDTTSSSSAQNWLPNDVATVTSANGAPLNGTLSAQLYTGDNCGATSGSAVNGQLYTKTLTNAASPASLTTNNTSFTVSASTSVSWLVTFASTDSNVKGSSHCEVTSLTITN